MIFISISNFLLDVRSSSVGYLHPNSLKNKEKMPFIKLHASRAKFSSRATGTQGRKRRGGGEGDISGEHTETTFSSRGKSERLGEPKEETFGPNMRPTRCQRCFVFPSGQSPFFLSSGKAFQRIGRVGFPLSVPPSPAPSIHPSSFWTLECRRSLCAMGWWWPSRSIPQLQLRSSIRG